MSTWGYSGEVVKSCTLHLAAHEDAYLRGVNTNAGTARDIVFEMPSVRTLDDMSDAEKLALCAQYNCEIEGWTP